MDLFPKILLDFPASSLSSFDPVARLIIPAIHKYCHASVVLCNITEVFIFGYGIYISFRKFYEADFQQMWSSSIY